MPRTIHGWYGTPEYNAWQHMIKRCHSAANSAYKDYGARGIIVCDRWRTSFLSFIEDIGKRPNSKYSLDRIDNDGPYSPENCRWATREEQMNNTRNNRLLSHNGKVLTVAQWADELDLSYDVIRSRLRSGWSVEKTLSTPKMKQGRPQSVAL